MLDLYHQETSESTRVPGKNAEAGQGSAVCDLCAKEGKTSLKF